MRKFLLGTTAVVGLAIAAPVANAQQAPSSLAGASGLSVRLGGYFEISHGVVSDSADKAGGTGGRAAGSRSRATTDLRNDAEIYLYVDGRAANGLQYGAVFDIQMDNSAAGAADQTGVSFDELYGFMKGGWGELRFGQEDSAASLMQVTAPSVFGLGVSGQWDEFLPASNYILATVGDGNDATKIIYLSPQFSGFDFGLSYAPNRFEGERADTTTTNVNQRDNTGLTNEISVALRYRGTLGGVGVQAGLVGQFADSAKQATGGAAIATRDQNIKTYAAGLVLSGVIPGLAIGADYTWGNWRGTPGNGTLALGVDGSKQTVVGATYTSGALVIGAQYGTGTQSNGGTVDDRTQTYLGAGVAYTLAPGMMLFANYNVVSDENVPTAAPTRTGATLTTYSANGADKKREIAVAVAGLRLAF